MDEAYPDLILDARYEKVRDHGVVRSQAVRVAIGMNGESRRRVLGVERANRESASRWKDFLVILKARGLKGVEFGVSDDHAGLKRASAEVLPEAAWQHCDIHSRHAGGGHASASSAHHGCSDGAWHTDRKLMAEQLRPWLDQQLSVVFYDPTTIRLHGEARLDKDLRAHGMN